jgi:hypothetical protein
MVFASGTKNAGSNSLQKIRNDGLLTTEKGCKSSIIQLTKN